jgi:hypothetical protein
MKNQTGAVFIAFAAYANEDGEQMYAWYECGIFQLYVHAYHHLDLSLKGYTSSNH